MTPEYTKNELSLRNGQDKPEIWVAYKGQIMMFPKADFG